MTLARATAAARRSWGMICGVVKLPTVPMSNGVTSVSPITIVTLANGAESSSAIDWASDVRMFWPISTLPV